VNLLVSGDPEKETKHNILYLVYLASLLINTAAAAAAVNLLVCGDPEKGKATAEQETLATSISRLTALLGKAQAYVEDVVVSELSLRRLSVTICTNKVICRRHAWRTWW
jgi:hypothetical protein